MTEVKEKACKPSDFAKVEPMASVLNKAENEIIALNIMKILVRTGDTWRTLNWNEYEKERKKDGDYIRREKLYWNATVPYTESEAQACMLSKFWKEI